MADCITPCVTIDVSDITEGTVDGNGTFDVLMRSTREHLKREHDAGRITGNEFAQVYVAGMQAAMANATQFTLQKDMASYQIQSLIEQIGLTAEQLELIKAQTAQIVAQTLNVPKQGALLDEQLVTQEHTSSVEEERVNTQTEQTTQVKNQSELTSVQAEVLTETRNYQPMR